MGVVHYVVGDMVDEGAELIHLDEAGEAAD
jgi:hypothetical protein